MARTKTGLFAEIAGVVAPVYERLRLTIPAREALERENGLAPDGSTKFGAQLWRVTLRRPPAGLVLVLVEQDEQHEGLRLEDEVAYPGEWREGGIAWSDRGSWVPCPACGASLVWYEAGYVPGYRVCSARPYHHAMLSSDGRTATLVR